MSGFLLRGVGEGLAEREAEQAAVGGFGVGGVAGFAGMGAQAGGEFFGGVGGDGADGGFAAGEHGGLLRVGGLFGVRCAAFVDAQAAAVQGLGAGDSMLGAAQHLAVAPPEGGVGGGVVGEGLRLLEQGVEDEEAAVGVPPQGLPRGVGRGEGGDLRAQAAGEQVEQGGRAAVAAAFGEGVGRRAAVFVGRGVVVGAAGGVEAQVGGVAGQDEQRGGGQAAQGVGVEVFEDGVAVEGVEGGIACGGGGASGMPT